jgi:peptidoglycan/xylan/chitin deacetylase (PgdA/CDA1 family)
VTATPVFSLAEETKKVYLTFDDGPSTVVTGRILDTLKEENVKATFFIVSDRAQTRQETLKRIVAEGHSVGVHSATHEYDKIYASETALLKDVETCATFIRKTTGTKPTLYRFPGGGHEEERALIESQGYRVIGWNATCGDEEIPGATADALYRAAVRSSKGKREVVLLCHDSAPRKETADALPKIIAYYRENHYTFCTF